MAVSDVPRSSEGEIIVTLAYPVQEDHLSARESARDKTSIRTHYNRTKELKRWRRDTPRHSNNRGLDISCIPEPVVALTTSKTGAARGAAAATARALLGSLLNVDRLRRGLGVADVSEIRSWQCRGQRQDAEPDLASHDRGMRYPRGLDATTMTLVTRTRDCWSRVSYASASSWEWQ